MNRSGPSVIRALVSTIEPIDGGVPTMTRWICQLLEEANIVPVLAWYAPWTNYPSLSIPCYKIFTGRQPMATQQLAFNAYESHGIGSWLPELEFTNYLPNKHWRSVISSCQLHLSVSGNALCASPYYFLDVPFLAWMATPWEADRKERIEQFNFPRRCLDAVVNSPVLKVLEKRILCADQGRIIGLSNYTAKEFSKLGTKQPTDVMYMPIKTSLFFPDYSRTAKWRIGFSGRYCDPRKNISLLLESARVLINQGYNIELVLVGERKADQLNPLIKKFQLDGYITCYQHLSPVELARLLQSFDVFAIPSHQEGLCIAALEAMSCGVPVVSTRCGGPEDYVIPGITGELVAKTAHAFASSLRDLCINRKKRHRLSAAAVSWIESNASENVSRKKFQKHLFNLIRVKGYEI